LITTWVALVAATVNVDAVPARTEVGFAVILTVGAGITLWPTTTVAVDVAFPPAPVAVAV
jgi:hypothetical protein